MSTHSKPMAEYFEAATECNFAAVQSFIEKDINNINYRNEDEDTALHLAAVHGRVKVVKLLLERGAEVNAKQKSELTALHLASLNGHTEVVKLLLERDAEVNAKQESGITPLHYSIGEGYIEVATLLVEHGAEVNAKQKNGITPLHIASLKGRTKELGFLLEKGAEVNAKEEQGLTALHAAASKGDAEALILLLEKGADVNAKDEKGSTPLHLAAFNGHIKALELLLLFNKDVDVDAKDEKGSTPLHIASRYNIEAVKLLLESNADISLKNKENDTPLDIALKAGHAAIATLLREKKNHEIIICRARNIICKLGVKNENISKIDVRHSTINKKNKNPPMEVAYTLEDKENPIRLSEELKQAGFTRWEKKGDFGFVVTVDYFNGVLRDERKYTEYLNTLKKGKETQNNLSNFARGTMDQSINKEKPSAATPQKTDGIQPPSSSGCFSPIAPAIFGKLLSPGQELSDDDKEKSKRADALILCKIGNQFKLYICHEEEWQSMVLENVENMEWLGKARKIFAKKALDSIQFKPELEGIFQAKADLIDQLKQDFHKQLRERKIKSKIENRGNQKNRPIMSERQPSQVYLEPSNLPVPVGSSKRKTHHKESTNQSLKFFSSQTPSSKQPVLEVTTPIPAVAEEISFAPTASRKSLTVLRPVEGELPRPPRKSTVNEDDISYHRLVRLPDNIPLTLGEEPLFRKSKKIIPATRHSDTSKKWVDRTVRESLTSLIAEYEKAPSNAVYIRAIYYWIIRAFVNKGINKEEEPVLWELRNFLIHEVYVHWFDFLEEKSFLIDLAKALSQGNKPSREIPKFRPIDRDPSNLIKIMNAELEALKATFKPFDASRGGVERAFFGYYPANLGSCYASLIVIVECYNQLKKEGYEFLTEQKDILDSCKYKIRNKAVHVGDEPLRESDNSIEMGMPEVETLYKACSRLFELNKFEPRVNLSVAQEIHTSSNRSHCSSQPLSLRLR